MVEDFEKRYAGEEEAFLKCRYGEGMFSHEYMVQFRLRPQLVGDYNWMFVNKEDVVPLQKHEGLVRLVNFLDEGDSYVVGINDVGDHRVSRKRVYK